MIRTHFTFRTEVHDCAPLPQHCNKHTFRKKDQVVTIYHKSSAKGDDETIQVDPLQHLQQLVRDASSIPENIACIYKYEFCMPPTSLFEPSRLLRQANKPDPT